MLGGAPRSARIMWGGVSFFLFFFFFFFFVFFLSSQIVFVISRGWGSKKFASTNIESVKQANENTDYCQKSQKCRHESLQAGSFGKGLPFFALVVKEGM